MIFYLSQLIGTPIKNKSGEKIGTVHDLLTSDINKPHPLIHGLVVKRGFKKETLFVPDHDVADFKDNAITLTTDVVDLTPFIQRPEEILLVNDIYDKQIVDIDDRRLTRVNELVLESEKNVMRLKGVDVSMFGVMRRLGIPKLGIIKPNMVDWEDVQFLGGQSPVKFNIAYKNLEELHPVDIGRIIVEGPGYKYGSKLLTSLKDPVAADVLEELSPKLQKRLLASMKMEDIIDVVDHMRPDKAADLLLTLGPEFSQKIVPQLNKDQAALIQQLITYPSHSTGAYMTTDYIAIAAGITIEAMFERIHKLEVIPTFSYYVFVLENELSNKLAGILSPHDYFRTGQRTRVDTIMTTKLVTADPLDHVKESLKQMYRYNLSALPVVTAQRKLIGIITLRDASAVYFPKKWKMGTE